MNECFYPSKALNREGERPEKKLLKGGRPFNFAKRFTIYNLLFSNSAQIFSRVQFTTIHIDYPKGICHSSISNYIQVQLYWIYWFQVIHHICKKKRIEFICRIEPSAIYAVDVFTVLYLFIYLLSRIRILSHLNFFKANIHAIDGKPKKNLLLWTLRIFFFWIKNLFQCRQYWPDTTHFLILYAVCLTTNSPTTTELCKMMMPTNIKNHTKFEF